MKGLGLRTFTIIALIALTVVNGGCVHATANIDHLLMTPGFYATEHQAFFKHVVVEHLPLPESHSLHIYIEGDGMPWKDTFTIADDPTPRNALALALMQDDPANSIYLGRPCYFAHRLRERDNQCEPRYWTSDRYSADIIASMKQVVDAYRRKVNAQHIVLIGYSGGAVIATQLAAVIDMPVDLITLAGNLNVTAWTALHGYTPLSHSLDPFNDFTPKASISHHHFAAANDQNVPPAITASFTEKFHVELTVVADADHRCCWKKLWPELLDTAIGR
jgi:hypothetical protein